MITIDRIPHFIKYMGAKRDILVDIHTTIESMGVETSWFCDLFAGTSVVSYAMSDDYNVISNDIQKYSSVFASTYFKNYVSIQEPLIFIEEIKHYVEKFIIEFEDKYPHISFVYLNDMTYTDVLKIEEEQQKLIDFDFELGFCLFVKGYSGTYWSFEQCKWIDAIRAAAEKYSNRIEYHAILSALIFAMSYASQSTGHFAQYRTITKSNYNDILIYRRKNIWDLFSKKLEEIFTSLIRPLNNELRCTTLDFVDCLRIIEEGSLVYADPPYSSVHYSRFYHAIETLVKYDNPKLLFKGRYREDRHQSPFDQKRYVKDAFRKMFLGIKSKKAHLILSYSNNGMLSLDELYALGNEIMGQEYVCTIYSRDYEHMKMGRSDEYKMDVQELLVSYKRT